MIFKKWYDNYKDLKKEVDYYADENWRKEEKIRKQKAKIKELEKEIEELKNEKKSKRKNTTVSKRLQDNN